MGNQNTVQQNPNNAGNYFQQVNRNPTQPQNAVWPGQPTSQPVTSHANSQLNALFQKQVQPQAPSPSGQVTSQNSVTKQQQQQQQPPSVSQQSGLSGLANN